MPCQDNDNLVTANKAAKMIGCSLQTVLNYIKRGQVNAIVEQRGYRKRYYLTLDDVRKIKEALESKYVVPKPAPCSGILYNK